MSEKIRLDRKIGFQNTFYTKCINVIIDSIGPSIILRSIYEATTRENLSSGFPTERVSNQSPQLNRLARKLKLRSKRV